jgi:hypothetical protein
MTTTHNTTIETVLDEAKALQELVIRSRKQGNADRCERAQRDLNRLLKEHPEVRPLLWPR